MVNSGEPFAIVDIGSNTVKLTVFVCDDDGQPRLIHHESDTVRIGHGVSASGLISASRVTRLLDCLRRMETDARLHGSNDFLAVGTQAFRQATNGTQVRDKILAQTSWSLEIINGNEEARLTLEGAREFLDAGRLTVIADVGGASTEIVVISPSGAMTSGGSVPVGSGSVFDDRIKVCPPPAGTLSAATKEAMIRFRGSGLLPSPVDVLLLPGGTGNLLRKLLTTIVPAAALDRSGLALLHAWLATDDGNTTAARLAIQVERAQVLPASLAIVESLVELLAPEEIKAIPSGVGHGIAQMVCADRWPMSR